jgi:hypothetical protein
MKRLHYAIGLFAAVACSGLHAQTTTVRASIPFDFQIGQTRVPAGDYQFRHEHGWLAVQDRSGCHVTTAITTAVDRPTVPINKAVLQFNRYGQVYFLANIWKGDSDTGRSLSKSAQEKELANHANPIQTTTVALQLK